MVRIILDSSSDFFPEEFKEKNMEMVPYMVTFGSQNYLDGIDISRNEFFDMLIREKEFPKTATPSPGDYLECFEAAKEAGDEVICITLAAVLSGSYQNAMLAKEMTEYDKIYVIDAKTATAGIQQLANYACKLRDQGLSGAEIAKEVEQLRSRVHIYFMVDSLEYLFRGGRLSRTEAMAGKMMHIKPLLMLGDEGEIAVADKCMGTSRALDVLVDFVREAPLDDHFPFYSVYSPETSNCEKLEELLKNQGITVDDRREFGLTIGTHTGPGCAGVVYITKE